MLTNNELRILQNNLHKSQPRTQSVLNHPDTKQYAIILLQEQYWSLYTKSSPRHHSWTLYEPTTSNNEQPRAAIYTNNDLLSAAQVTQINIPLNDVVAIEIMTKDPQPILIVNIYKPCDKNIIPELYEHLRTKLAKRNYTTTIIAGDFNLHHPLWNPSGYIRQDDEAERLVEMMTEMELNLLIPAGTITYPNAGTAIDLVWGNDEAKRRIIKCQVAAENDHTSDHLPIETIIATQIEPPHRLPSYNYSRTNWKELNDELRIGLSELPTDSEKLATHAEVDTYAQQLVAAIQKAIRKTTPRRRPSPHSKRWWSVLLTRRRREANKLRNRYKRTKNGDDRAAWRAKSNEYLKEVEQAKESHWKEYVSNADEKSIYQIKDYITNNYTSTFIPTLDNAAATAEQKFHELKKAFFPKPPPADLADIRCSPYPPEIPYAPEVTIRQIREVVNKLAPNKAPGPDEITNRVLKHTLPTTERYLKTLMQASLTLGHFPKPFKQTTTVVLRKPNKPDYTKAKAYRPVALENTLGKIMESVVAEDISYLTETYELLPAHHFGGRPGRSAEDAMMILSESIYKAWKEKKVYTAIFMDVAGAFNNIHHERLIHNLRQRRIPEAIARWISSFLQGRSMQLQFNGIKSESIPTPAGVPQGSPLSPLLYMYYNADLLEVAPQHRSTRLGFIDDIAYGVQGRSGKENVRKLKHILSEAEEWRKKHGAQFEPSKYILVHFTRNRNLESTAPIQINGIRVEPSNEAKYLGVIFDKELRYHSHLQHIVKKGTSAAMALFSIAKNSWGAPYKYIRQLFQSVIAPRVDYAASIWHRPKADGSAANSSQIRKLSSVQRVAMKAILGCYKTTPTAAMEVESGLEPPWIRLQTKALLAVTRMQSLSAKHPIHVWLANALRTRTAAIPHRSNLENILQQFPHMTETIETIEPFIRPPWWVLKAQTRVEQTKDMAKKAHDEIQKLPDASVATLYTDGSGTDMRVGAAAYSQTSGKVSHHHLGGEGQFNVYTAEITAMHLAIERLWDHETHPKCRIFTDSQAAIKAIERPQRQSGQSTIKGLLDSIDETCSQAHTHVEIMWIPGHSEIQGNERADAEAKKAATASNLTQLPRQRPLKSARARYIKAAAREQWRAAWNGGSKTAKALRHITKIKRRGDKVGPKLYNGIKNRSTAAMITQLRTGHCGLNHYLHRFGINESPFCECGYGKETVEHFLLECRKYKEQRKKLREAAGTGNMKVGILLGDPSKIRHTMAYIKETGRLSS